MRANYLIVLAAFGLCACVPATSSQPLSPLEADLAEMMRWFPGEYDNHEQVYKQAKQGVSQDMRQRHTNHSFQPLTIPGIPGKTLYAQQYQHYDPTDIYRQRIYSLEADEAEQAIRLTIYTPKQPERLIDAHLNPAKIEGLTVDDFFLKPGCEVYWRRAENQFEGFLKENACSYYSDRFATQVYLNETLILRKDALVLHDTALDAQGQPVFGSADKGPTVNLKRQGMCEKN